MNNTQREDLIFGPAAAGLVQAVATCTLLVTGVAVVAFLYQVMAEALPLLELVLRPQGPSGGW